MRAREFVAEELIGTLHLGDIVVDVDDHSFDRKVGRKVPLAMVDRAVRRLPNAKEQILNTEAGQKFWVYNLALNVALGLRKKGQSNRVLLKSVLGKRPWDSQTPIVDI